MRDIKFRYWNTTTKQMVNDPPMPHKDGWTIEQLFSDRGWIWMQFTGLLDRHGKDIYEGDILRSTSWGNWEVYCNNYEYILYQEYCESIKGMVKRKTRPFTPTQIKGWKIIGHIYENPDLLPKETGE